MVIGRLPLVAPAVPGTSRPRVLLVADEVPLPADTGYRLRLGQVLSGLTAVADVDLFCAVLDRRTARTTAAEAQPGVARSEVVHAGWQPLRAARLAGWARSGLPRQLHDRDWSTARERLRAWRAPHYDLVWFSHSGPFTAFADLLDAPRVVDLDNLEDVLSRQRRLVERQGGRPVAGVRERVRSWSARVDEARWAAVHARAAATSRAVVVCSDLDGSRLGGARVVVVPNGYATPTRPAGSPATRPVSPVLLFVGNMQYAPNADAAWWCATRVLPRVRAARPDVRLRVVGHDPDGALAERLAGLPGVDVVGAVPAVEPELAGAGVVVVPLRYGSGTRLKVLEAFAHRVPVVSTTLGAEGLGAVDGRHALLGDTPAQLAQACLRLLDDRDLRVRLTDEAARLHAAQFSERVVRDRVADVLRSAGLSGAGEGAPRRP